MMESVGLEKGLIRFVSENGIKERTPFVWTRRVISYTVLLAGLIIALSLLLFTRKDFETDIIRQRGTTYQVMDDGTISNIYEVNLLNKTRNDFKIKFKSNDPSVSVEQVTRKILLKGGKQVRERILVKVKNGKLDNGLKKIEIEVYGNGELIETIDTKFIGPLL
jgi:hypothetical protein